MRISQDRTPDFLPEGTPKYIILGTMVAINARTIDGTSPKEEAFYYNNSRNHFWRVLQRLYAPAMEPLRFNIPQKKEFLEKHKIAIVNLVQEIEVPNDEAGDPSDTVLFKAQKRGRLKFKRPSEKLIDFMADTPMFFTCRHKKGINDIVENYFASNGLSRDLVKNIHYLPTPTRCNPLARSLIWKREMKKFNESFTKSRSLHPLEIL